MAFAGDKDSGSSGGGSGGGSGEQAPPAQQPPPPPIQFIPDKVEKGGPGPSETRED